jgi:hypothetical protein
MRPLTSATSERDHLRQIVTRKKFSTHNPCGPRNVTITPDPKLTATTPMSLWLGSCSLKANEIKRMTTGLNALSIWMKDTLRL